MRQSSYFKIGITGDPEDRAEWYEQDGDEYDDMVVVYETYLEGDVKEAEAILIDYLWEYEGRDNEVGGGGGSPSGPPYYLYLVRAF